MVRSSDKVEQCEGAVATKRAAASRRYPASWQIATIAACSLLPGFLLKDPWPADEPRFVLIAREMLARGDLWILFRAGEPYSDKPPLFVWVEAVILTATDSIRWAHQLPGLLASVLVLFLTWDLGRRLWNRSVGFWAAAILVTTVQFVLQGRSGQIDATLCAFTTLGLWGIVRGTSEPRSQVALSLGFVAAAGGVATKGVGFLPLLALIPSTVARWLRWRRAERLTARAFLVGVLLFGAVLLAWLVPLALRVRNSGDPALENYLQDLLLGQTVARYAQPVGHVKPWWYYGTVVLWAWMPVSFLVPWVVPAWCRRLRRRDARYLVLLGWIVLVVLFFSASSGKRGVYLLPATPALALAVAPLAPGLIRLPGPRLVCRLLAAGLGLLLVLAASAVIILGEAELRPLVPAVGLSGVAILAVSHRLGTSRGPVSLVVGFSFVWTVIGFVVYPVLDAHRSGRLLMETVEATLTPHAELAIVDWREQMVLQSTRPIVHFGYRTDPAKQARAASLWLGVGAEGQRRVLVPARYLVPCFAPNAAHLMGTRRREWHLATPQDVSGFCRSGAVPSFRSAAAGER